METLSNPNLGVPELSGAMVPPQVTPAAPPPAPAVGGNETQQFDPQTGAPLSTRIAQNSLVANKMNPGPGNWAANLVAGVQSALAGVGSIGTVPPGAGGLYGAGKVMEYQQQQKQQRLENQMKQQQLAQQQTNADREYQLRLAENARQQTKSVADMSEHDLRMKNLTLDNTIAESNYQMAQLAQEETAKAAGAKPLMVGGAPAPTFKDAGEAENYANNNKLAQSAVENGYRTRPIKGADGQFHLYEMPDTGPKWMDVKDAAGKTTRIFGTPLDALNFTDKVTDVRLHSAEANEHNAKAAADRLAAGNPLPGDAVTAAAGIWRQAKADPDFNNVPKNRDGSPVIGSPEYQALDKKYGLTKAQNDALDSNPAYAETSIARMLVDANMDPSQLSKRSTKGSDSYNRTLQQASQISMIKTGQPFDIAKATEDYKYANQKSTQDTIKLLRSLTGDNKNTSGTLSQLQNQFNALGNTSIPKLNELENWASQNRGKPEVTNFAATLLGVSDEMGKILGGGVATDSSRQEARDIIDKAFSSGQGAGAINSIRASMANRQNAMVEDNRYMMKQIGTMTVPQTVKGNAQGDAAKLHLNMQDFSHQYTGAKGTIFSDDGKTWYDGKGQLVK